MFTFYCESFYELSPKRKKTQFIQHMNLSNCTKFQKYNLKNMRTFKEKKSPF